jgi:hypothetical protein
MTKRRLGVPPGRRFLCATALARQAPPGGTGGECRGGRGLLSEPLIDVVLG